MDGLFGISTGKPASLGVPIGVLATMSTAGTAHTNSTTETSLITGTFLGSKTIAAEALNVVGRTLRVNVRGVYSTAAVPGTLRFFVRVGGIAGVIVASTFLNTPPALSVNRYFEVDCLITTRATGATGNVTAQGQVTVAATGSAVQIWDMPNTGVSAAIDLTAAKDLAVTADWGTADGGNTITAHVATIEVLN